VKSLLSPSRGLVRRRSLLGAAVAVLALATATACSVLPGGGDTTTPAAAVQVVGDSTAAGAGQTGDGGTPPAPPPGPVPPATWVQMSAANSPLGTIVTDVNKHTLYRFDEDKPSPPTSNCSGQCATTWPPETVAPGGHAYLQGIDPKVVGTVTRSDGSQQMTIGGWPVYRFAGDTNPGETNGQGIKGTWFAVSPTGSKASTAPQQGAAPPPPPGTQGGGLQGTQVSLTTEKSSSGTVIADGSGHTVYVSGKDSSSKSHCSTTSQCSGYTPVPAASGQSVHVPGVKDSDVGTARGPGGTQQMTLYGYPLYTSSKDQHSGDTKGDDHGGKWYAMGLDDDG
jgi:predicted lipoprotein with Yx(FWY)xxD motif